MNSSCIAEIKHVSLQFDGTEKPLFKDLNFEIYAGDFIVLIGGNGSGKSTFIKLFLGESTLHKGSVVIQQKEINDMKKMDLSTRCFMLSQNVNESLFPDLSVYENFLIWKMSEKTKLFMKTKKEGQEEFKKYIADFNSKLSPKMNTPVRLLSGGEKQALLLGLIFLDPPDLLLLDEHISALDPKTSDKIMRLTNRLVSQHKIACVMITHDLHYAENFGNRIVALKDGMIILDSRASFSAKEMMHMVYDF